MKNNKGFSLVELIIVIAIMAILVGVMAPQLIKYIEKTNVSADVQLCDSVREAIQTAMMDPTVVTAKSNGVPAASTSTSYTATFNKSTPFDQAVAEILGTTDPKSKLKSSAKDNSGAVEYRVGSNSVLVYVTNSDINGKKSKFSTVATGCIYAGDETLQ